MNIENLTIEQRDCYDWAKTHNYWHTTTISVEQFLTVYHKPSKNGLRAQFENEKALNLGGGTGLNVENSNQAKQTTGGNYATHYGNHKKLTAAQRAKQLGERANACHANVIDSTAIVV